MKYFVYFTTYEGEGKQEIACFVAKNVKQNLEMKPFQPYMVHRKNIVFSNCEIADFADDEYDENEFEFIAGNGGIRRFISTNNDPRTLLINVLFEYEE